MGRKKIIFILIAAVIFMGMNIYKYNLLNIRNLPSDDFVQVSFASRSIESRPDVEEMDSIHPGVISMDSIDVKDNPTEIKIMSFNIRYGTDDYGNNRLDSIIEEIRESGAHIIGLQEVEKYMPRSGFADQAKEIAESLGYEFVYGGNINILGIQYGNAIISAYPIIKHNNYRLPHDSLEPRGLLKAVVDVEDTNYNVFVTHLGLSVKEREEQIREIDNRIEGLKHNTILIGDFNCHPHSSEMEYLRKEMVDSAVLAGKEHLNTFAFYSDFPNTRIDRIYVSDNIEVLDHDVTASVVSDHSMVITKIYNHKD